MLYQTYQPRSPLSQFVEFLWVREGSSLLKSRSRLLPTGSVELVINLHEDKIPLFDRRTQAHRGDANGATVCGAHSEGFIISNDQKVSFMGVHFKPGGGAAFFIPPAGELHNQIVSLETLWSSSALELRDRLLKAQPLATRFRVLEQFLLKMMQPSKRHPAVDFALCEFARIAEDNTAPPILVPTVRAVTEQIGFSTRHFNQLFRDQVGLTPKLYCRIQRLQQVLSLLAKEERVNWLDVALACGYFDQAHFIHDFRKFADCTPSEYLARRSFHPCHVTLLG